MLRAVVLSIASAVGLAIGTLTPYDRASSEVVAAPIASGARHEYQLDSANGGWTKEWNPGSGEYVLVEYHAGDIVPPYLIAEWPHTPQRGWGGFLAPSTWDCVGTCNKDHHPGGQDRGAGR